MITTWRVSAPEQSMVTRGPLQVDPMQSRAESSRSICASAKTMDSWGRESADITLPREQTATAGTLDARRGRRLFDRNDLMAQRRHPGKLTKDRSSSCRGK